MGGKLCAGRTQSQPLAQGPVCRGHRDPRGEASVINAAADRRHLLDLDHLRTDRACAGGRAAFAVAMVARRETRTTSADLSGAVALVEPGRTHQLGTRNSPSADAPSRPTWR